MRPIGASSGFTRPIHISALVAERLASARDPDMSSVPQRPGTMGAVAVPPPDGVRGHGTGDEADARRIAELQRQRDLWNRDMELHADLASDAAHRVELPPLFEFEYGPDGRTYAVAPVQHVVPPPDPVELGDVPEAEAPREAAPLPVEPDHEELPSSEERAPGDADEHAALSSTNMRRAFEAPGRVPAPGSRLVDEA